MQDGMTRAFSNTIHTFEALFRTGELKCCPMSLCRLIAITHSEISYGLKSRVGQVCSSVMRRMTSGLAIVVI